MNTIYTYIQCCERDDSIVERTIWQKEELGQAKTLCLGNCCNQLRLSEVYESLSGWSPCHWVCPGRKASSKKIEGRPPRDIPRSHLHPSPPSAGLLCCCREERSRIHFCSPEIKEIKPSRVRRVKVILLVLC